MPRLRAYILFLLVTSFLGVVTAPLAAQQPSAWWYPLGNPEATRSNPVPTLSQQAEDIVMKWRASTLKNSPVILVGGIRSEPGETKQQIVGMEAGSNQLKILGSSGFVQVETTFDVNFGSNYKATLTGLFNTTAPTPVPLQRPDVIGIGVERAASTTTPDLLWGGFADRTGKIFKQLTIAENIAANSAANNRIASVFPVAAFTPTGLAQPRALGMVNQPLYTPKALGDLPMINGPRAFQLSATSVSAPQQWRYNVAPMVYTQHPALVTIPENDETFLAYGTGNYRFADPSDSVGIAGQGLPAGTHTKGAFTLRVRVSDPTQPRAIGILSNGGRGESESYFATIITNSVPDTTLYVSIITENHDSERPGLARISLGGVRENDNPLLGNNFFDPNITDIGWTVLVADLDGTVPGHPDGEANLPNNRGNEIIGALRSLDGADVDTNWIYVFRRNTQDPPGPNNEVFWHFTRQFFSGKLVAAGDLVSDPEQRWELIITHGDTLTILQMKPYTDEGFSTIQEPKQRKPFRVVKQFVLDSPILSVAVADLEGNGSNDIIATTELATYALGKALPQPFGTLEVADTYCDGTPLTLQWNRTVAGGDNGVRVRLVGDNFDSLLVGNITGGELSVDVENISAPSGTYKLIVQDEIIGDVRDETREFTITHASISPLSLQLGTIFSVDDIIADTLSVKCVDVLELQLSEDQAIWTPLGETVVTGDGSSVPIASGTFSCDLVQRCAEDTLVQVYIRVVHKSNPTLATDAVPALLHIPHIPIQVIPGDTSRARRRVVQWAPGDFSCNMVAVSLSRDGGKTWQDVAEAPAALGKTEITISSAYTNQTRMCVHCADERNQNCAYGLMTIDVGTFDEANYVAPNPFNPAIESNLLGSALIVYTLNQPSTISVTIYDASRSIVRELVRNESREIGINRTDYWDGRNSRGEIVANGTYICRIETGSGEIIILPIIVKKQ